MPVWANGSLIQCFRKPPRSHGVTSIPQTGGSGEGGVLPGACGAAGVVGGGAGAMRAAGCGCKNPSGGVSD